jgi:hypothetical protein
MQEETSRPYLNPAIAEHDYFAAPISRKRSVSLEENEERKDSEQTDSAEEAETVPSAPTDPYQSVWLEHNYCLPVPPATVPLPTPTLPSTPPKPSKKSKKAAAAAALQEQVSGVLHFIGFMIGFANPVLLS